MEKIISNIEELRKIIEADNIEKDEALEFLEAIEDNATDLQDSLISAQYESDSKDSRITELEDEVSELEAAETDKIINCGIGEIEYINPGNLVLQEIMENLDAAIKKQNPKNVNELLYQHT